VYRGTLEELTAVAAKEPNLARGEITLLIEGAASLQEQGADQALLVRALKALLAELPPARAAALAAQITGVKRSEAYALAQRLRSGPAVEVES
jgi:16S rRNA (cytidine1402-2'-O)-methyltransferase